MRAQLARAARAACAVAACLAAAPAFAQEPPDFSGVWSLASRPMTAPQGYPDIAFTPEGRARVEAYRALVDPAGANPTQHCVTHGMPEMMMGGGGYPLEIIQKPDQVTMISEAMSETRRVYLGGRIVPEPDRVVSRHGYSQGHWEDGVLVVETAQMQELPDSRYPHSAGARITERFHLEHDGDGTPRLIADTRVEDPLWLAEPLEYRLEWTPSATGWILPYECSEEDWFAYLNGLAEAAGAAPAYGAPSVK